MDVDLQLFKNIIEEGRNNTDLLDSLSPNQFKSKERWLKTFPRITASMVLCQFFYIKNQSHEKD